VRRSALIGVGVLVAVALAGCTSKTSPKAASSTSTPASSAAPTSVPASNAAAVSSSPAPASSSEATPTTAQSLYDADSSGIVRIMDTTCDTVGTGTGFLIGPNLIATVGHVVAGADDIRVTDPALGTTSSAVVLGFTSNDQDLALLQTPVAIPGHVFTLSTSEPAIGAPIVVLGFSKMGPDHISDGLVESIHQHAAVGGGPSLLTLSDLALTNAATNPGDSGGPWLDPSGQVLALTDYVPPTGDQGENGGVPAVDAAPSFTTWQTAAAPSPLAADGCARTNVLDAAQVTLTDYFIDIDASDYDSAYAQETVATSADANLTKWIAGVDSSQDGLPENFNADGTVTDGPYYTVNGKGMSKGVPYLDVSFRSTQDGLHGTDKQTCTDWTLRYSFELLNGVPLIKSALPPPGVASAQEACPSPANAVNGAGPSAPAGSVVASPAASSP